MKIHCSRSFVSVFQTSDVLGAPESKIGNINAFLNGGRLQTGCYSNENNISECNYCKTF